MIGERAGVTKRALYKGLIVSLSRIAGNLRPDEFSCRIGSLGGS